MNSRLAAQLEIFYGEATAAEARIYARLPRITAHSEGAPFTLQGEIVGPFSDFARCLPAKIPLREPYLAEPRTADAQLVAAVVPDPCFWLPEEPYCYRVKVEIRQGNQLLAEVHRTLGIRPLGIHQRRFYLQGKPWVVRAVVRDTMAEQDWEDARLLGAALFVSHASDELCQQASRQGVLVVAALQGDLNGDDLAAECRRLAEHAAVGLIVGPPTLAWSSACQAATRNILLGCRLSLPPFSEPDDPPSAIGLPEWANFALVGWPANLPAEKFAESVAALPVPVCAEALVESGRAEQTTGDASPSGEPSSVSRPASTLSAARAACDRLQSALAGRGEFAGYVHF